MEQKFITYIGASPEHIWEILTKPEYVKQIFFGSVLQSTFEPGSSFQYVGPGSDGDETVHVYGKVLVFEPCKVMSFLEHPGPSYYDNHAELESRITMTLEPAGGCTKLILVNDQWTDNHPSMAKTPESWPALLSNIKTLAETGKTLDFGW